jgi:hypothetical protein
MLFGPDPLGERLTLLWHNHFATSNAKVGDLGAMRRQTELFRTLGRGPFGELLTARLLFGDVTPVILRRVGPADLRVRDDAPAPQATEIGQTPPAFVRVPVQEFGHAAE